MEPIAAEVTEKIPADDPRENHSYVQQNIKRKNEEPCSIESNSVCPLKTIKMDTFKVPMLPLTARPKATDNKAAVESAPPKSTQVTEKKDKKFDWRPHYDFWTKDASKICPQCGITITVCFTSRRDHYVRFHYDIYYSIIGQRKTESWISQRLGCPRSSCKQRTNRVCLHCDLSVCMPATVQLYGSRIKLLAHIEKDHPEEFGKLKAEYIEMQHNGQVKDTDVHNLLTSVTSSRNSSVVEESEKLPKPQNKKRINRKNHTRLGMFSDDFHLQPAPEAQKQVTETPVAHSVPPVPLRNVPQPLIFLPTYPVLAHFPNPMQYPFMLLPSMFPYYGIPPTMTLPNLFSSHN